MQTLKTLRDQVLGWLDEAGDTATTKTNVDNAINQAHQTRCMSDRWSFMLWPTTETVTTNGTSKYPLHEEYGVGLYFRNAAGSYLTELPTRQLDQTAQSPIDTSGNNGYFTIDGISPIASQPSDALPSVITIVSTSALDTGVGKAIVIRGNTLLGGVQTDIITPTGTTPAVGVVAFASVLAVTKSSETIGTLTLTVNQVGVGQVVTLVLPPGLPGRQFPVLRFYATPAAGIVSYRFYRKPRALVLDYDIPDIPDPFSQILVWDTLLMFAGYNTDISGRSVDAWRDMQGQLALGMQQTYLNPHTIGAMPRFVRVIS